MAERAPVVLGRINGLFGVSGWVKVYSYTRPARNLIEHDQWLIGRQGDWRPFRVLAARNQAKTLIAQLADPSDRPVADRDGAAALLECDIAVPRAALPEPEPGRYYWFDLMGLDVVTREGTPLGRVASMMETGANDVLVVDGERERLIPFVMDEFVDAVDLDAGRIVVDWDPDF
ncbi:ribosome maturation factor RimM [Salinisphaera orenii]|uniref:ribosome maturation factor RimM n=1 Tax=Salinisphaera orenii TaxID=856731 RepID=UPI000F491814|nr:ribosome maturation factor RimM [Salinisphaera halophila]